MSSRTVLKLTLTFALALLAVAPQLAQAATTATPSITWTRPVSLENPAKGGALDSISCVLGTGKSKNKQLCVAGDQTSHRIWWSQTPSRGRSAWHWASVDNTKGASITGMSCPTITFCVAVDSLGDVVYSRKPTGGRHDWTNPVQVDSTTAAGGGPAGFAGISCPTTTFCAAIDNAGEVVTSVNPTGGASAWTLAALPKSPVLTSISCPSITLCVIGGSTRFHSINPTGGISAWIAGGSVIHGVLSSLSCPSATLCVGVGYGDSTTGLASATATPTGASTSWLNHTIDTAIPTGNSQLLDSVSCPSVGFCVAVDGGDNAFDTVSPLTGAWTSIAPAHTNSVSTWSSISCEAKDCVVVDSRGYMISADVHGVTVTTPATTTTTTTTKTTAATT